MYYNYSIKPYEYEEANSIFATKHFDIKDLDYIVNQEDIYPLSYKDWKEICMFQKSKVKVEILSILPISKELKMQLKLI